MSIFSGISTTETQLLKKKKKTCTNLHTHKPGTVTTTLYIAEKKMKITTSR